LTPSREFREQAQWIWTHDNPGEAHVWIYARREFAAESGEGTCVEINADLRYFLWLNGHPIGFGPPKYHAPTPTVDRYDLTPWVKPGRNVIVVRVYSYGAARNLSSCMPVRGALRVAVRHAGGTIVSNGDWKVRRERGYVSPTVARGEMQPPVECFDARRSLGPVWLPGYDDADWEQAVVLPELEASPRFELRDIPLFGWREHEADRCLQTGVSRFTRTFEETGFTRLAEEIWRAQRLPDRAARISHGKGMGGAPDLWRMDATGLPGREGVYAIWDGGRIWTGYPCLRLRGSPGTVADVSFGECLQEGRVNPTKHGLHYLERIVLGKDPVDHHVTWPKCCRYIQVDVRGGWVELHPPVLARSSYPVERKGCFACSDPALDQVWEISVHTVELCMEDGYMDTPWRERGSWLGDDVPKALVNYAVFGDLALARRFLLQHARGQRANGQMAGKYPGHMTSLVSTWSLMFPVSVREYVRHGGDTRFAKDMLPVIERIIGWMEHYRLPEGVYGNLPLKVTAETNIYNFIDSAPLDTSGANAAWNAHAYGCLQAAVSLARLAGEEILATRWQGAADRLREAFSNLFWDERRGVYLNGWRDGMPIRRWGCQENYLAVYYGIADPHRRERIMARLKQEDLFAVFEVNRENYDEVIPGIDGNHGVAIALNLYRWDENKMVPLGGPYFAWFALEALLGLGMTDEALTMIGKHWGEFSRQGGTTVWETWDRDRGSLSHGWGCAPAIVLQKFILGVRLSEEQDIDLEILPQRGALTWARGRVNTPHGVVQVAWQYDRHWRLEVDVPEGCRARVGLPGTLAWNGAIEPRVCHRQTYETVVVQGGHHEFTG
jgi:hypothetical protein